MPPNVQLTLWATPGADTWRGPSHDGVGCFNPEGFSFKALVREPEAREHRKRIIAASRFHRAIPPVPVLLFGVTTLRVTCNITWVRRKALKSRQRAILVDLEGRTPHQRQYFRKFRLFRHHGCMHQACRQMSSSRCGPRPALLLGEDQAMMVSDDLILKDFYLRRLCASQAPEKTQMP